MLALVRVGAEVAALSDGVWIGPPALCEECAAAWREAVTHASYYEPDWRAAFAAAVRARVGAAAVVQLPKRARGGRRPAGATD